MKINDFDERMKKHASVTKNVISPPYELKMELDKLEEKNMNKHKNIYWLKKVSVFAAVVALCTITVVSADSINGFFKDVTRWDGAIIGSEYANATNDINITTLDMVNENGNEILPLNITIAKENEITLKSIQEIAITEYQIVDMNDKEILKVSTTLENATKGKIENGKALLNLFIKEAELDLGKEYKIVINNMFGLAKADGPLEITGNWNCKFVR